MIELCNNSVITFSDIYDLLSKQNIIDLIEENRGDIALYIEFCNYCQVGGKIVKLEEDKSTRIKNILINFIHSYNKDLKISSLKALSSYSLNGYDIDNELPIQWTEGQIILIINLLLNKNNDLEILKSIESLLMSGLMIETMEVRNTNLISNNSGKDNGDSDGNIQNNNFYSYLSYLLLLLFIYLFIIVIIIYLFYSFSIAEITTILQPPFSKAIINNSSIIIPAQCCLFQENINIKMLNGKNKDSLLKSFENHIIKYIIYVLLYVFIK